ncbi:MAG TPA: iron ABC transporter permease [Streptosporangiaceae bacterium]|nr:iron ABC transporter permease [Streptosporangiaceae bacterium]
MTDGATPASRAEAGPEAGQAGVTADHAAADTWPADAKAGADGAAPGDVWSLARPRRTGGEASSDDVPAPDDSENLARRGRAGGEASSDDVPAPDDSENLVRRGRAGIAIAVASVALAGALVLALYVGPAGLSLATVADALLSKLPWHPAVSVPPVDVAIIWQIRAPRVVLAALVGAMLSGGGAAYQGVFRNPLADPYLLGVAAGAGLAATIAVVAGASPGVLPPAAFAGGAGAVAITYVLGSGAGRDRESPGLGGTTTSIVLAGVAVAALLTAIQTYVLQQHTRVLQQVYSWVLGELSLASWSNVTTILPYVAVSAVVLLAHRRLLDVLRVGEAEASALGVDVARVRLTVVLAATLGTAAAVSMSGLIGFVGIIVPHTVRLAAGSSYRIVLPVSMIGGAAFLVLADLVARTAQAPAEVPIGVITAAAGAPFFLFVLRSSRTRRDLA